MSTRSDTAKLHSIKVKCPHCRKTVEWSADNRYRPFCSQRCRLIDLGDWASESHKIPGDPTLADIFSEDQSK